MAVRVFDVALEVPEQEVVVEAGVVALDVGAEDERVAVEVVGVCVTACSQAVTVRGAIKKKPASIGGMLRAKGCPAKTQRSVMTCIALHLNRRK